MIRHLLKLAWNRKRSNGLVILEIAASFLVVFAVVAFGFYLAGNWRRPLGFTYRDVWNVRIDFGRSDVAHDSTEEKEVFRRLLEEARATDGVVAVAGASAVPYDNSQSIGNWLLEGRKIEVAFLEATDGLRDVLGLDLARGRWFEPADSALAWEPVVIDEGMSRALYDDGDAVGKKLPLNDENGPEARVVGVVRSFRKNGELAATESFLFRRIALESLPIRLPRNLVLKMRPGIDASFEQALLERLHEIAPQWSFEIRGLDQLRESALQKPLGVLALGGVVGGFLLLMSGLGLLGVLWQNVTRRAHEIGLRRAMGASRADIGRQVLLEVALTTTLGLVPGLLLVAQLPLLDLLGFVDDRVFVAGAVVSALLIYLLTVTCALYPGLLAARIQPAETLHQE